MNLMGNTNNLKRQYVAKSAIIRGALVVLALLVVHPAYSATINVTSRADILANDGVCTLREAVISANENFPSGGLTGECPAGSLGLDTIVLTDSGIYGFSIPDAEEDASKTGDLDITEDVDIEGGDATTFVINASALDRIFYVKGGDTDVAIRKLTLTGGMATYHGSGIYNEGNMIVEDSIIISNRVFTSGRDGGGGSITMVTC